MQSSASLAEQVLQRAAHSAALTTHAQEAAVEAGGVAVAVPVLATAAAEATTVPAGPVPAAPPPLAAPAEPTPPSAQTEAPQPAPAHAAPTAAAAQPAAGANGSAAALRLLQFEAEMRRQPDATALLMYLANESRALVPFDQCIVWRLHRPSRRLRPAVVSGLSVVDRHVPLLRALSRVLHPLKQQWALTQSLPLNLRKLPAVCQLRDHEREVLDEFSLPHLLWLPMKDVDGAVNAGLLLARAEPFTPGSRLLLERVAEAGAHAFSALSRRRSLAQGSTWSRWVGALAVVGLCAAAMMPVRLSVMAPVEVVAAKPRVITAPISGVVKRILVAPSATVAFGEPLVQFDDVQLRNEMLLAQQRLAVAQAKDARTSAAAFQDPNAAHELATARAEFTLARVSYRYAIEVLQRTVIESPQPGVVIYGDRRDWEGRAVQVGEEILQVADPREVAYRIDLSTGNSLTLANGGELDVYLDNVPLGGLQARVRTVSYTPRTMPNGDTSYTVMAAPEVGSTQNPRIGARGMARLYGEEVPLIVQLLRRPITALRQWAGI